MPQTIITAAEVTQLVSDYGKQRVISSCAASGDSAAVGLNSRLTFEMFAGNGTSTYWSVKVESVICNYGSLRYYLRCPVDGCNRRVMALWTNTGAELGCRQCMGVKYETPYIGKLERCRKKANRLRCQLGGKAGSLNPLPDKPKQMHWRTYGHKLNQIIALEDTELKLLKAKFGIDDA